MSGNNLLAVSLKSTIEITSDAPAWIRTFKKLLTASFNDSQPWPLCKRMVSFPIATMFPFCSSTL